MLGIDYADPAEGDCRPNCRDLRICTTSVPLLSFVLISFDWPRLEVASYLCLRFGVDPCRQMLFYAVDNGRMLLSMLPRLAGLVLMRRSSMFLAPGGAASSSMKIVFVKRRGVIGPTVACNDKISVKISVRSIALPPIIPYPHPHHHTNPHTPASAAEMTPVQSPLHPRPPPRSNFPVPFPFPSPTLQHPIHASRSLALRPVKQRGDSEGQRSRGSLLSRESGTKASSRKLFWCREKRRGPVSRRGGHCSLS